MPRTWPTRTRPEVTGDVSGYVDVEQQGLMRAADATPFKPDGALRSPAPTKQRNPRYPQPPFTAAFDFSFTRFV